MKRLGIIYLLSVAIVSLNSCDYVKKAVEETFNNQEDSQENLKDTFHNPFSSKLRAQNQTIEKYRELIQGLYPTLDSLKFDYTMAMLTHEIEKWNRTEISLLFQPERLDEIQAELYTVLNTEDILLYSSPLFVEHQRVRLPIVNPSNPNEVDWYWYESKTGKWAKKDPVKLTSRDLQNMEGNSYPLATIKLRTAHQVLYEVINRFDEIGFIELPSSVTYYSHPHKQYWTISLRGDRSDYSLETDSQGKFTKLEMR